MDINNKKIFLDVIMFINLILVFISGLQRWRSHSLLSYIFIILLIIHFLFNWNWIKHVILKCFKKEKNGK